MDKITFSPVGGKPVALKREIPPYMRHLVIPGGIVLAAKEWFGTMLYQVAKLAEGTGGYWVLQCEKDVTLHICRERSLSLVVASLEQDINCFLYGLGNIYLPTGSFTMMHLDELEAVVHFRKGKLYRCLALDLDIVQTLPLLNSFTTLHRFLTLPQDQYPAIYSPAPVSFNNQLHVWVTDLLTPGAKARAQNRANAISMTLYYTFKIAEKALRIEDRLLQQLEQLHTLILKQTHYMPDVKAFATGINQSESNIRKFFKQVYGLPPYKYWQHYRMHYYVTRQLLETGKKIKEIATSLGYGKAIGNFNRIFKQFCGLSPRQYRLLYKGRKGTGRN